MGYFLRCVFWLSFLTYLFSARTAYSQKQEKDSLRLVLQGYELRNGLETDTNYLNSLNDFAFYHWSSNPDSVILLSNKSYALSSKAGYKKGVIHALTHLATGYFEKGNYHEALRIGREALEYGIKIGDEVAIITVYQNMSLSYNGLGKYADAIDVTMKALEIAQRYGLQRKVAHNYMNMALHYKGMGNLDEAQKSYQKAIEITKILNDEKRLMWIYTTISYLQIEIKNLEAAEFSINEALRLNKKYGNNRGLCIAKQAKGILLMAKNKPKEALSFFLEAKQIQEGIGSNVDMGSVVFNIAECYEKLAQYQKGLEMAQEAFRFGVESDDLKLKLDAQYLISVLYKRQERYKEALFHYEQFRIYLDSMYIETSDRDIVRIEEQYNYRQKETELKAQHAQQESEQRMWIIIIGAAFVLAISLAIVQFRNVRQKVRINAILEKNRDEINSQKQELEAMGMFKDRLLSVVSHDVKGPLNSLTGMLDLYNQKLLSNEDFARLMGQISVKIKQINIFVNDLLLWARTQMTGAQIVTSKFDLQNTIDHTIELLKPAAERKKINLKNDEKQSIEIEADEEMIKIVVRNLISNAIKYCVTDDVIEVATYVKKAESEVVVSVRDSGLGISPEKLSKLFGSPSVSSQGTEHEIGTGLGLLLSKQYIEMNRGAIGVESEVGKGSHFCFSLPLVSSDN